MIESPVKHNTFWIPIYEAKRRSACKARRFVVEVFDIKLSLDPGATREIERVIQAIAEAGTKVVMSTHNLGQAKRLGDEILFLHEGRLAERAPVDRFFTRPASLEAEAFIRGELPWT